MGTPRRTIASALCWVALAMCSALVAAPGAVLPAFAAAPVTLQVSAAHGLLGLHHSALTRFLAAEMAQAGLPDWRFVPQAGNGTAADRVEWSFTLNPYGGGEVRNFVHPSSYEGSFGRRPVTIEVRLYLDGQYQTLVETQALVHGGRDDPDLAAAVMRATENLLGPEGAYRSIDLGQYRSDQQH